jgi:uncharacterized membrane protein YgdD (TMEM256/DUF423 family)
MNFYRPRRWLLIGALLGGLGVTLGAFGAHGLKSALADQGLDQAGLARALENWETAARYQMYHALALLAVGWLATRRRGPAIHLAGAGMTLGTLIFSGCLYLLVLTGQKWLGAIVPLGGTLLIAGWACLAAAAGGLADSPEPADKTP